MRSDTFDLEMDPLVVLNLKSGRGRRTIQEDL